MPTPGMSCHRSMVGGFTPSFEARLHCSLRWVLFSSQAGFYIKVWWLPQTNWYTNSQTYWCLSFMTCQQVLLTHMLLSFLPHKHSLQISLKPFLRLMKTPSFISFWYKKILSLRLNRFLSEPQKWDQSCFPVIQNILLIILYLYFQTFFYVFSLGRATKQMYCAQSL